MIQSLTRASLLSAMLLAPAGMAFANGMPLAQHRAGYELTLLNSRGKGVAAASGRIGLEFTGNACEGYATNFRQLTQISDGEGKSLTSDMRLTTFEGGDGKTLRFNSEKSTNGANSSITNGRAERASDGGISVDIKQPKLSKIDVDGVAIFPTDHMIRLIAAARTGERVVEMKVYDGSDGGEKIYDTTALIGSQIKPDVRPVEEASKKAGLQDMARWPVSISYFEPGNGERTPVYVLSFELYENGVSGALKLDFGEFSLKGELIRLEILKDGECKK